MTADAVGEEEATGTALAVGRRDRAWTIAFVVFWAAVLARLLVLTPETDLRIAYLIGLSAFLAIHLAVLFRQPRPTPALHIVFGLQAAIVLVLFSLRPERDILMALLALECYQAAVVFRDRTRLVWVAVLVALIGASLVGELGLVRGLARAFLPMAAAIVLSTFVVVNRELEDARASSERIVADLQTAQDQLREYAAQVDELAAIEERSRLARGLQESVSATLASALEAGASARELLDDRAAAARALERLQALAQQALAQMRAIIEELRPSAGLDVGRVSESAAGPVSESPASPSREPGAVPASEPGAGVASDPE